VWCGNSVATSKKQEQGMSDMEINPMNKWTDEKVSELAIMRFSDMPILQRMEAVSMTHMFSFWKEVQETLFSGVEEIKRLTARIDELEKQQKV
jgi:hypothetical protein